MNDELSPPPASAASPSPAPAETPAVDVAGSVAAASHKPADHPAVASGYVGVLLVNLGTPAAAETKAVRRYLTEFLSDPRVIEEGGIVWQFIRDGFILRSCPRRRARDYAKIWNNEANESPLITITRSQCQRLAARLEPIGRPIITDWAMRYGEPSIGGQLRALLARGCDRILLVPLYPQYAAATTATACDEAFRTLLQLRWQPTLRVAAPYYDDPIYIDLIARSLEAECGKLAFSPDVILASFHGIPKDYFLKGDPYYCQCAKTYRLLRERMQFDEVKFMMTFQSRFGRAEWLQPYTDATVKRLAKSGVKNLVIITPALPPTAWRPSKRSGLRTPRFFTAMAGRTSPSFPVSTTAISAWM